MKLTSPLFEAYLKCPTKCYLRSTGQTGAGNAYADWVREQNDAYRKEGVERVLAAAGDGVAVTTPGADNLKTATWRLAVDLPLETERMASRLNAVERVPPEGRGGPAQFVPVRFVFWNKLTKDDRLLLGFDTLVLSAVLGCEVSVGKIIHGDDHATLKIKVASLLGTVRQLTARTSALLAGGSPPDLVLKRHCAECEFQHQCRQKAVETDDLSLLSAMTEKERTRHRSKGIFTVAQLSYTFRPRRISKRVKNPSKPHLVALKALAVREKTIYIHGNPQLPDAKARIYLDVEGLPDNDFYYLAGALIIADGRETFHSFWADTHSEESDVFAALAETICGLHDFRVFHYGNYEAIALKRMRAELPQDVQLQIDLILEHSTNVLSVVHPHVYLPTYSNSLKDIGRFLGFPRTHEDATGLQTIVWRKNWQATADPALKDNLSLYNRDDCFELKHTCEVLGRLIARSPANPLVSQALPTAVRTEEMIADRPHWDLFRPKDYALDDFEHVAKCAYFDYQREKVFVRTHRQFATINKRHRKHKHTTTHPNEIVEIECDRCPRCKKKSIQQTKKLSRLLIDLKFSKTGVKRWITQLHSYRYKCQKCLHLFGSEARNRGMPFRYGRGFMSWCVYTSFFCDMKMSRTRIALGDTFAIFVDDSRMMRARNLMTAEYETLYASILDSLLQERVLHVDETSVNLVGSKGYVWVIASMDKVYYFYRPTREGTFLQEMLHSFTGVLVSDFYKAYDALQCEQQKCLVHFVRDIDDDLLKHPLDMELKDIAQEFGTLLRTIVQTVDRYGLKRRHLRKHKCAVSCFLHSMAQRDCSSELADAYKKRFQKSGAKMFTFLEYDGVPWNNINAEHAIKRFAKFRTHAGGRFTERSLREYLVLASVFETCAFNNVNVLRFLLSGEKTMAGLLRFAGRRSEIPGTAKDAIAGEGASLPGSPT